MTRIVLDCNTSVSALLVSGSGPAQRDCIVNGKDSKK
jgi:hypothetical protein